MSVNHRFDLGLSLRRLAARPRSMALLAAVPLVALLVGVLGAIFDWRLGVDSAVYRAGALTLLTGEPLYESTTLGPEPWWALLPFTYPPTAALLFVPLAPLPVQVAWGVVAAASVLAMALVVRITIATLPGSPLATRWWASPARATLLFSVALLIIEPVWRTVFLGQINLILMALIVVDVLLLSARPNRFGGVLVGVAAAVKLTPLIFVPHLFFTGRRWEAVRALITFVVLQGLMFVLIPGDAARFWGHAVSDPGRTGPLHWAGNQSLNGLVSRLSELAPWSLQVALAIGAVLAVPALWLMLRYHRRGQALPALLVTAFYGLLISPVSWSHHWVWAVPLIVLLVSRLPQTTPATAVKRWLGVGAIVVVFLSCVLLVLPNGRNFELHWDVGEYLLGSAYLMVPLVLAIVLAGRWARRASQQPRPRDRVNEPAG